MYGDHSKQGGSQKEQNQKKPKQEILFPANFPLYIEHDDYGLGYTDSQLGVDALADSNLLSHSRPAFLYQQNQGSIPK